MIEYFTYVIDSDLQVQTYFIPIHSFRRVSGLLSVIYKCTKSKGRHRNGRRPYLAVLYVKITVFARRILILHVMVTAVELLQKRFSWGKRWLQKSILNASPIKRLPALSVCKQPKRRNGTKEIALKLQPRLHSKMILGAFLEL